MIWAFLHWPLGGRGDMEHRYSPDRPRDFIMYLVLGVCTDTSWHFCAFISWFGAAGPQSVTLVCCLSPSCSVWFISGQYPVWKRGLVLHINKLEQRLSACKKTETLAPPAVLLCSDPDGCSEVWFNWGEEKNIQMFLRSESESPDYIFHLEVA